MLMLAIILFSIAAILGLYLLTYIMQGKNTPKGLAFIHGPIAATALLVLILYVIFYQAKGYYLLSIAIFALAAVGGLILIFRDIMGKSVPLWMALGHGLLAISAFLILVATYLQ